MNRRTVMGPHTIEDWLAAPGRWTELINGHLIIREEAPCGLHQYVLSELWIHVTSTIREADRADLRPVPSINVEIRTLPRTAVIPDLVVLNVKPVGLVFTSDQVELVAEVWSVDDSSDDRTRRFDLYAKAGIRHYWTVELDGLVVAAYELRDDRYQRVATLRGDEIGAIEAAAVPVTIQPAQLVP
jgi:Uma2 family endonuclease